MTLSRGARWGLTAFMVFGLSFIYIPLSVVVINSFNIERTFGWPPKGYTLDWWAKALENTGMREALWTSVKAGLGATAIALVLGSMIAFAIHKHAWFGRNTVSFLVILPIALPGIVTGVALGAAFQAIGLEFGLLTVIIGHATFCIVLVFNNVIARLRRAGANIEEASADLGATGYQTFLYVTFPTIRTALLAGALLAFGLSFDEIVVTTFTAGAGVQTLPLWIYDNLARPNQAPIVNVVAAALVLLSIIPIYISQRIAGESAAGGRI